MKDFPAGHATAAFYFTTHASDGSPVAPSSAFEAADVKLFKNGSDVERTSTSGWTMTSSFNGTTGLHRLLIDLSDNTDAGFYSAGATYAAVLNPDETVDGISVLKVIGEFSIGFAVAAADVAAIKAKTDNLPSDPADQSLIIAATDAIMTAVGDVPTNAELATALAGADDAVLAQVALVKAKTDGLTFTVAGVLDANIQYVNDVLVTGNGQPGSEWGP